MGTEPTLGEVVADDENRTVHIRLNIAHPAIRAAAFTCDEEMLNCFLAEVIVLGAAQRYKEDGDWPWPHDDWPDFVMQCDRLASKIRHLQNVQ